MLNQRTIEEDLEDEIVWPSYSEVAHAIDVDKVGCENPLLSNLPYCDRNTSAR